MAVLRSLFWIIAVSFLLAGGNGIAENYGKVPGSSYVDAESPAYASSERVVASVAKLKGACAHQEEVCSLAAKAGHFILEALDGGMKLVLGDEGGSNGSGRAEAKQGHDAPFGFGTPESPDTSFFHGVDSLLYKGEEELDDIG